MAKSRSRKSGSIKKRSARKVSPKKSPRALKSVSIKRRSARKVSPKKSRRASKSRKTSSRRRKYGFECGANVE